MPQRVALYRQRQSEKRASRALRAALQAHFEGRYGHAEREADEAQELPETAGLAALVAARSAHRMREYGRRDEWLRRAEADPGLRAAKLMTEAECLVDARDGKRALTVVEQLHAAGSRHIQSLRLALKAHQYAGDWDAVLKLLRTLNKRDALHPAAARQMKALAYRALFAARGGDSHALLALWQSVPQADKHRRRRARRGAGVQRGRPRLSGAQRDRDGDRDRMGRASRRGIRPQRRRGGGRGVRRAGRHARRASERRRRPALADRTGGALDPRASRTSRPRSTRSARCARATQLWGKAQAALREALERSPDPRLATAIHFELGRVYEEIRRPREEPRRNSARLPRRA